MELSFTLGHSFIALIQLTDWKLESDICGGHNGAIIPVHNLETSVIPK
jgi:hypothetical protein